MTAIGRDGAARVLGGGVKVALIGVVLLTAAACDQQTASTVEPARTVDTSFEPRVASPAFAPGQGPLVCFDAAHNNFHALDGTYAPFGLVLRSDGFELRTVGEPLTPATLQRCRVLVIADAQPPARRSDPPTFSPAEVEALETWVREGGSLFVITDHMPDPGAIREVVRAFGIEVNNGYVLNGAPGEDAGPIVFRAGDGALPGDPSRRGAEAGPAAPTGGSGASDRIADDPVTRGRSEEEGVRVVATFAGSAFRAGGTFRPLLLFGQGRTSWMPEDYWEFREDTPTLDVSGWSQGGVGAYGEGRVAFFAEAAMFTAQIFAQGTVRAGMNAPEAEDNLQLLLNVMRWLVGEL